MINCWGNSVRAETRGWDVQESKANLQADDLKTGFSYDPVWRDMNNEVSHPTCKCLNMIKSWTQMSENHIVSGRRNLCNTSSGFQSGEWVVCPTLERLIRSCQLAHWWGRMNERALIMGTERERERKRVKVHSKHSCGQVRMTEFYIQ